MLRSRGAPPFYVKKLLCLHWEKIAATLIGFSLIGSYGFGDDYSVSGNVKEFPLQVLKSSTGQGRPLLGAFAILQFRFIYEFSDFFLMHLLQALLFVFLAIQLKRLAVNLMDRHNKIAVVPFVMSVLASAGPLTLVAWGVQFGPLLAVTVSLYAVNVVIKRERAGVLYYLLVGVPIIMYQPGFVLVFTILGTAYLFSLPSKQRSILRKFLNLRSILVLTTYLILEVMCIAISKRLGWISGERSTIVSDFQEKGTWVLKSVIPQALQFGGPRLINDTQSNFVLLLVIAGLALILRKSFKQSILLALILVFSISPSLITAENWASNRSMMSIQFVFSFAFFLFLAWIGSQIFRTVSQHRVVVNSLVLTISLVSGLYSTTVGWKNPQLLEISIAKSSISKEDCKTLRYVRPSGWQQSLGSYSSMDEFGIPSTTPVWSVLSFTKFVCKEKGYSLSQRVKILDRLETPTKTRASGLIDYQMLLQNFLNAKLAMLNNRL